MITVAAGCGSSGGGGGCVLTSVDEGTYVTHNEAVFRSLPVPPGARQVNAYSIGMPAPHSCFPHDTGPPYCAFGSWRVYALPPSVSRTEVVTFYRRALRGSWTFRTGGSGDATFRRGEALLYVVAPSGGGFLLSVDYKGYAGGGH